MIVTCPNCTARYKVPESKITERGAKITCPNCAHKFVVRKDGEGSEEAAAAAPKIPGDLARRDFKKVGILWKVRRTIGMTYDFSDLATLREYMSDGQVGKRDELSYDHKKYVALGDIPDLDAHFWDIWQKAEAGEVSSPKQDSHSEDDSDAPTTIVGQGSSLADEIRKAVADVATPAPAPSRAGGTPVAVQSRTTVPDEGLPSIPPEPAAFSEPEAPPVPKPAELPKKAEAPPEFKKLTENKAATDSGGGKGKAIAGVAVVIALVIVAGSIGAAMLYASGVFGQ